MNEQVQLAWEAWLRPIAPADGDGEEHDASWLVAEETGLLMGGRLV